MANLKKNWKNVITIVNRLTLKEFRDTIDLQYAVNHTSGRLMDPSTIGFHITEENYSDWFVSEEFFCEGYVKDNYYIIKYKKPEWNICTKK